MKKRIAILLSAVLAAAPAHAATFSQAPTGGTVNATTDQLMAVRSGTSVTSNTIATGTLTFTTQSGLGYVSNQPVTVMNTGNSANFMYGKVTSYSGTSLVVNVTSVGGSGREATSGQNDIRPDTSGSVRTNPTFGGHTSPSPTSAACRSSDKRIFRTCRPS